MTRGFSLLEVLAATVVLGLLAVAVVPMTRRLLEGHGHQQDRITAREMLENIDLAGIPTSGVPVPMSQRPGWWVRSDRLSATVPPVAPGQADPRPLHAWRCIELVDGPGPNAQVLEFRLVMEVRGSP